MESLIPRIREIAERINSAEGKRKEIAGFLKSLGPESGLVRKLSPDPLKDTKVVGVDGGVAKRSLHGFDCMLARAAGVCFHYRDGRVDRVDYLPSRLPVPRPEVIEALSDLDWAYFTSISRQRLEVRTALECMEKFRPGFLLMDGSIVPHHSDRPSRSSPVHGDYMELVSDFKDLYKGARDSGVSLAGVIEDSRGNSFCRMISSDFLAGSGQGLAPGIEGILEKTRDTNLLFWVLERGERSMTFPYSKNPGEHPVLRDLGDSGKEISSFYLKTARWDRPIRVDFLPGADEDRLASVLLAISGHHPEYGIPAPLIEADNVAKLSENEIENFYSRIISFAGNSPGLMRLRREQRPF
jgi:hypothetical protein